MLEPLTDPLFREAVATATAAGLCLGLLGVYIVSRRMVFISAALAQTSALGVTIAFVAIASLGLTGAAVGFLPMAAALLMSLLVVAALVLVGESPTLSRDAILGIAFIVPMALMLLLVPLFPYELHEIAAILNGNAVVVERGDMYAIFVATAIVLITQVYAFRGFVYASLDPLVARTQGVPVRALDAVLFGSIAIMTALATRAIGPLPTFALTVLPAIGALGLNIGLKWVFVVSAVTGALSAYVGWWVTLQTDWSVGATQALTAAVFALTLRAIGFVHRRVGDVPGGKNE